MSAPEKRPAELIAAELIAVDVANTQLLGRLAKTTPTALIAPYRTGPPWAKVGIIGAGLVALVGGSVLAIGLLGGGSATRTPGAVAAASATPTATATGTPTATTTPTSAVTPPAVTIVPPTASPTASPSPSPSASPTPPVTGESLALGTFRRVSGDCPIADTFNAAFGLVAENGELTMTQLPVEHLTSGTVGRTGVSEGRFVTAAEGQTYDGTITGSTVRGVHVYTSGGCNDTYEFEMRLDRPFLAPPPYGIAPGFFEFLDAETFASLLALPPGQLAHLVVASLGQPDMTTLLPIHVVLTVDSIIPWDFTIAGDTSRVCRGPTGCSADAPSEVDAAWLAPDQRPLLVAYGADGAVIAVYAPNGVP